MTYKYFALVQVDEGYIIVPSDTDNTLEIKHGFCHKQDFSRTCVVETVVEAESFTKWIKALYIRSRCDGRKRGYLVAFKLTEDERDRVESLVQEHREGGCDVYYNVLLMTEGEYRIAQWLLDDSKLGPDGAMATARALGFCVMRFLGVKTPTIPY